MLCDIELSIEFMAPVLSWLSRATRRSSLLIAVRSKMLDGFVAFSRNIGVPGNIPRSVKDCGGIVQLLRIVIRKTALVLPVLDVMLARVKAGVSDVHVPAAVPDLIDCFR